MSKKINARTINAEALANLSNYNVAYKAIVAIKAKYKALLETAEKELSNILEKRGEAIQQGLSEAEITEKYPRLEADKKIRALENERDEALKPHNDTIRACVETVPNYLYGAYIFAMQRGMSAAVPKNGCNVEIQSGKKTKAFFVDKSFAANIADVCKSWGLGHADDDKAVMKFADLIKGRIAGMKKSNKGDYLDYKGERVLNEMFLLATIQYFLTEGIFVANEDNTLAVAVAAKVA